MSRRPDLSRFRLYGWDFPAAIDFDIDAGSRGFGAETRLYRRHGLNVPRHIGLPISPQSGRIARVESGPGLPRRVDGVCMQFERAHI